MRRREGVYFGTWRTLVLLLACLCAGAEHLTGQDTTLRIVVEASPSRNTSLTAVQTGKAVHVSLKEMLVALGFTVRENLGEGWIEARSSNRFLTFFANNSYYSSLEGDSLRTRQMPSTVVVRGQTFLFPLTSSLHLFPDIFGSPASFNHSSRILTVGKPAPPKPAFDIPAVEIEQRVNGVLLRVRATRPLLDYEGHLKQDGWYYLTIRNAKADVPTINKLPPSGSVKKIVAIQHRSSVQLTFQLAGRFASSEILTPSDNNDLVVSLRTAPEESDRMLNEQRRAAIQAELEMQRKKFELDVIVLDAGHGGKDPGTIGVSGTREKDIALAIVLKLGALIKKNMKDVKVVYTRDDDRFVELDKRGRIANEAGGKLFISVHCNAMPRKPHARRGFEVYLLRPGRTDEAIAIAERENSVIQLEEKYEERYKQLTDENFILVTMAQMAHMRASELFAELATQEMAKRVDTRNNGVKQAGFLVLVGASMPNVLVETAYLSNKDDETILKSTAGQQKIAEALFNAIKLYKTEYEKMLREGRELGTK